MVYRLMFVGATKYLSWLRFKDKASAEKVAKEYMNMRPTEKIMVLEERSFK